MWIYPIATMHIRRKGFNLIKGLTFNLTLMSYESYVTISIGVPAFRHVAKVSGLLAFQLFAINTSSGITLSL